LKLRRVHVQTGQGINIGMREPEAPIMGLSDFSNNKHERQG
jgi:hypothetical protein